MTSNRDQQRFKAAARRFASGVTVVTTRRGADVHGITASSFSSLSLDPLLVTVAVDHRSRFVEMVESAKIFAVSVLARGQHDLSRQFATPNRAPSLHCFEGVSSYRATTGSPILTGSIAYFDCRLHSILLGGDHRVLVGEVAAAGESGGEPLLYFEGDYHGLGRPHAAGSEEPFECETSAGAGATSQGSSSALRRSELLAVQGAVEPTIAQMAASMASAHDLDRLRGLLSSAAQVVDQPHLFTDLSVEFHMALADACGSESLQTLGTALGEEQRLLYEAETDTARANQVLAAHRAILDRIVDSEPEAARAAMQAHIADMQHYFSTSPPTPDHGGASSIDPTSIPARSSESIERPA